MAVRMNTSEAGGFKLLEEDALDDRPCAAVKKFVSSVLERKDMKDADVASSFRNLMEYRDSTSSPSQCSVSTSTSALDSDRLDRLNSPPSPSSPPGPMDDQRLPNELLDEICEDIGMKEGMELDFVELLMEQDTNPHMYMTPEAISSGAFNSGAGSTISTPTGSASGGSNSGSSGSNNNSSINNNNNNDSANKTLTLLNTPSSSSTNTTTPNFLFKPNFSDSDWLSQLPSPLIPTSSGQSSGTTTIQSSENNSPANKRIHLSQSTDTSPNKGRSQTPPGFNQHIYQSGGYSNGLGAAFGHGPPSSSSYSAGYNNNNNNNSHSMFKMPQGGPPSSVAPPKRSHSYPQGAPASSPVHSTTSSLGSHSSSSSLSHSHTSATAASQYQHHHHPHHHHQHQQQQQQQQQRQHQHQQSQMQGPHEFSINPPSDSSDHEDPLSNNNNNIKNNNNNKVPCVSPKPVVPTSLSSSSASSALPFIKPGSPMPANNTSLTNSGYGQNNFGPRDGSVFQRVGKPGPPPNVNVKSMQEQQQHQQHNQHRWMGPHQKQGPMPNAPGSFYGGGKNMYPGAAYPMGMSQPSHPHPHHMGHHSQPHHHMGPPGPLSGSVRPPADSPLDQGYFSNESAGNCSSGSAPSPAFTTSSMSSFSSISTMMPADQSSSSTQQKSSIMQPQQQSQGMPNGRPQSQKSVHFADMPSDTSPPAYPQNPTSV
ncbi:hypothetical protein EGW08_007547, partial [Elysia chlorotica]